MNEPGWHQCPTCGKEDCQEMYHPPTMAQKVRWSIHKRVDEERDNQDLKWGEQDHHPDHWLAILTEEVGEAAKASLEGDPAAYMKELIQVAAVAFAALEAAEHHGVVFRAEGSD